MPFFLLTGSRYIYDLYYEKEAISKPLYDWLLKNNYADAMLIAKWKKQGYEKVSALERRTKMLQDRSADFLFCDSFAACAAFRPKRPTSTARAFAACRGRS